MLRCTDPQAQPVAAAGFWVLFITICSFVMLSLFVGVITIAMSDSIQEMQKMATESLERRRAAKKERLKAEEDDGASGDLGLGLSPALFTFAQRMQMQTLVKEASELLTKVGKII